MTSTDPAESHLIDLQRLAVAIRRRRRLWLSLGLLGLVVGGLLALFLPSPPVAVAKLVVVHQDDSPTDSGTLMRTDVAVLQTTQIANAALKALGSTQSPEDFLKDVTGLGVTNNVLQISVKGTSNADAIARTKALSDAFIADHVQRNQAAATAQAKALIDQRNKAQGDLAQVDASIGTESAKNKNDQNPTELESLYARRAQLTAQISDFEGRAQQAGVGSPQVAAGTQIVDAPRVTPRSLLKTGATNGGIGLALGLAIGLALAAVTGVVRDRPVLRREVSAHLGASVIAQLSQPRRGPSRLWRRSRGVTDRQRVATTLVRAVRADRGSVSLLELEAPAATAALAMDLATELAASGPVALVDDLPGAKLTAPADGRIRIVAGGDLTPGDPGERRLGVGSVAPGTAWTDLSHLGTETVLVVRAGRANTLWLHTVARQLADSGIPIIGVVLVDPDPRDKTDGTLWDGLHTALRGRAGSAPRLAQPVEKTVEKPVEIPVEKPKTPVPDYVDAPTRRFAPISVAKPKTGVNGYLPVNGTLATNGKPHEDPEKAKPTPFKRDHDHDEEATKRFAPVGVDPVSVDEDNVEAR